MAAIRFLRMILYVIIVIITVIFKIFAKLSGLVGKIIYSALFTYTIVCAGITIITGGFQNGTFMVSLPFYLATIGVGIAVVIIPQFAESIVDWFSSKAQRLVEM